MLGLKPDNVETLKTAVLLWTLMVLLVLLAIQMIMIALGLNQVRASELNKLPTQVERSAMSYEDKQQHLTDQIRSDALQSNRMLLEHNFETNPLFGLTREEVHLRKHQQTNLPSDPTLNNNVLADDAYPFEIYDAWANLYDDYDYDGFYQSFSVVFDADYYGFADYADVYADLYLSQDGGPWFHYFSTDVFRIFGNSETDSYEVITTLYEDYPDDYYDVLIDLYEAGYPGVVATISGNDIDALYALPLESSDYDEYYDDDYYDDHHDHDHGSLSLLIGLLGVVVVARLFAVDGPGQVQI